VTPEEEKKIEEGSKHRMEWLIEHDFNKMQLIMMLAALSLGVEIDPQGMSEELSNPNGFENVITELEKSTNTFFSLFV